ncbi:gliding motility-associated-like protein [Arcicella aurantiaca]|uniref:Gliding motility-associated-like protein n=1 Tax=Arcicella aurantiaca TaxID=591202 RepID=A0A316ECX7_9BACT|nr:gliding motility-associated-like protein [Arcicella aurantiaca]
MSFQATAENVIGGTLEFTHKTGSTYNVKTIFYIDKGARATSPDLYQGFIRVSIYSKGATAAGDVLMQTISLNLESKTDNFPYDNSECVASITLSTTKFVYSSDITINKSSYNNARGYYLVWQDGNRNVTTNANATQGMTCYLEFPPLNTTDNSSPVFKLNKGVVACRGNAFSIDLGATDKDNNTLTYALVNPFSAPATSTVTGKQRIPDPRRSPIDSYDLVVWNGGYSATSPIPGVSLNSNTGVLSGTPTAVGKYLVVVECKEYNGSNLIGINRMDFEIVVENCTPTNPNIYLTGTGPAHLPSVVICSGSYRILETPYNSAFTYEWKKNGTVISGATTNQIRVNYADAGTYTVTRRSTTCVGTGTSADTQVNPQAGEDLKLTIPDSTICSGNVPVVLTITQNSTGAALSGFQRQWFNNGVLMSGVFGQFTQISVGGKYSVKVTQFAAPQCTYEAFKEVIVTPTPSPSILNTTGKISICDGEVVKLQADPVETDVNYFWVKNSLDIKNGVDLDVTTSGTYGLRAESTKNPDCFDFAPVQSTITVNPNPIPTFAPVAAICNTKSSKIDLRNYVTPTYVSPNGVFTGSGIRNGYEFDPTASGYGAFPIKYTYTTAAGCPGSASQTIVVDLTPSVKLGNDVTIFRGDTVRLRTVGSTGPQFTYQWTPTTNLNSPSSTQPLANPDATTPYVVKVSTTSGCSATAKITVTVRAKLKIPSAFTPNSDTFNDTWVIMENNREFNDYPDIEVKIYNRWGSEIFYSVGSGAYQTRPFDGIQDGARLPAGPYFYVIKPSPDVPTLTGYVTIVR